jgi:hypothetical protein
MAVSINVHYTRASLKRPRPPKPAAYVRSPITHGELWLRLYGIATANKFMEPVHAKTRTAGCKASLTSCRTCFYVLSTGKNWPNRKAHATGTCDVFTSQTTRIGPQKSFGMTIIFCVRPVILDSQSARTGPVWRKSVTLAISLSMLQVSNEEWEEKSGIQTLTWHVLVSHFPLVFPISSTCQVSTTYVTRACQVRVPSGLQEGLTKLVTDLHTSVYPTR